MKQKSSPLEKEITIKKSIRLFTLLLVLAMLVSAFPAAFAANGTVATEDYRLVYDLATGTSSIVDINSTNKNITFVEITLENNSTSQVTRAGRVYAGQITFNVTSSITGSVTAKVDCYQTPTMTSSSGNTMEYSHLWYFERTDATAAGATYTMYGNLGYTKYTNAIVVDKNYYSPANWGITTGAYALANNFYVANPEFFGGDPNSALVSFTYN